MGRNSEMSGGHFDYSQYKILQIAEEIEKIISENDHYGFSSDIIEEFVNAIYILKKAYIYAQRIDWLVSDDDGEESFKERLFEELYKLDDELYELDKEKINIG